MRIEVERIKDEPVESSEDIDAKSWSLDSFDIKFIKNIHIDCKFIRLSEVIVAECSILTHRFITCSRCLEKSEQEVNQNFKLSYSVASVGDYLEVDRDLREEILLNFPMRVLCKPDCRGICLGCGANLNFEKCRCKK